MNVPSEEAPSAMRARRRSASVCTSFDVAVVVVFVVVEDGGGSGCCAAAGATVVGTADLGPVLRQLWIKDSSGEGPEKSGGESESYSGSSRA